MKKQSAPTHQLAVNIPYELYKAMGQMVDKGQAANLREIVVKGIEEQLQQWPSR